MHLATSNEVIKSLHRFFNRSVVVKAVDLEQVDVVDIQSLQAGIDGVEDRLARETTVVGIVFRLLHFWFILEGLSLMSGVTGRR
jgi:hypothetical protein